MQEETYVNRTQTSKENENDLEIASIGITVGSNKNNVGVVVKKVSVPDSKLFEGDIIVEINREKILNPIQLDNLLKNIKKTGRTSLLLKIIRDQESLWITKKFLIN